MFMPSNIGIPMKLLDSKGKTNKNIKCIVLSPKEYNWQLDILHQLKINQKTAYTTHPEHKKIETNLFQIYECFKYNFLQTTFIKH